MLARGTARVGLAVALAAVAAGPAEARRDEVWSESFPFEAGGRVAIANIQGSIQVEGWDRSHVELTVRIRGEEETGDAEVVVTPGAGTLEFRTTYLGPSEEPVAVDYFLRVPRQVRLESLQTVNGDIVVRNVEGAVTARTLNGSIETAGVSGRVEARTMNGEVRVALRRLPEKEAAGAGLSLEAINGSLTLLLPAEADADLEVSTVAGRVQGPVVWSAGAAPGETLLRAKVGRGGVRIRLRTIRGDIRVGESVGVF
jgi:hypothetical protein